MGGRSKSSTTSNTSIDNSVHTHDLSNNSGVALSGMNLAGGSSVSITATDHGAVAGAFDFASNMGEMSLGFGESALLFADSAMQRAGEQTGAALASTGAVVGQLSDLTEVLKTGASQKTVLYVSGGILLFVGIVTVVVSVGARK